MKAEQVGLRMNDEFACPGRQAPLTDGSGTLGSVPRIGMHEALFRDCTIVVMLKTGGSGHAGSEATTRMPASAGSCSSSMW